MLFLRQSADYHMTQLLRTQEHSYDCCVHRDIKEVTHFSLEILSVVPENIALYPKFLFCIMLYFVTQIQER